MQSTPNRYMQLGNQSQCMQPQMQNAMLAQNMMQRNTVLAGFNQPKPAGKKVEVKEEKKGLINWFKNHKVETVIIVGVGAAVVQDQMKKNDKPAPKQ